ncbi:hypothetical protein GAO09_19470 [Rhizobiales bacterium RZME27]|uniref:Uncharacterized protein n=2 Tax=Endobacterium cereale TaxID=2663029 RepID=A0A6A8AEJ0_9HYPH|nr:hypothetical protein [Endobacterium cereale]
MATAGHNSNELTDKERQALFAHHVRTDISIEAKIAELREQKKANRKLAQNDGFPSAKIDHYTKALQAEDKQKPVDKHRSEKENLIWLGLIHEDPNGDLLADRATKEQKIFAAGQAAGLMARDRVSNYDAGSVDDKTWLSGWDDGQRIVRENLESAMNKRNAAKAVSNKEEPASEEDPFPDADTVH